MLHAIHDIVEKAAEALSEHSYHEEEAQGEPKAEEAGGHKMEEGDSPKDKGKGRLSEASTPEETKESATGEASTSEGAKHKTKNIKVAGKDRVRISLA